MTTDLMWVTLTVTLYNVATTGVGVTVVEPVLTRNVVGRKAMTSTCKDCASLGRDCCVGAISMCESK